MRETYLTVAGRIRREVADLDRVVRRTTDIWQQATRSSDDYHVDATALNLHGFYAGLERLFEIIADRIDRSKPTGAHWHQELLRQMSTDIPDVRPPVLSSKTYDELDRYRGFRHVVRNVYTYNLDPEQVDLLVRHLRPSMDQVSDELLAFADFLEQLVVDT